MMVPDWAGYQSFREVFSEIIDERYFPLTWLDERILSGRAAFFRSENAALVVELRRFPGGALDAHVLIAAGDKQEIIGELTAEAEEWARLQGCTAAVVESRQGWKRALAPMGYEPHQLVLRKELGGEVGPI